MTSFATIRALASDLARAPRAHQTRLVLHDALLERYPDEYEWTMSLVDHMVRETQGWNLAARIRVTPRSLALAERHIARGRLPDAQSALRRALTIETLSRRGTWDASRSAKSGDIVTYVATREPLRDVLTYVTAREALR